MVGGVFVSRVRCLSLQLPSGLGRKESGRQWCYWVSPLVAHQTAARISQVLPKRGFETIFGGTIGVLWVPTGNFFHSITLVRTEMSRAFG